MVSGFKGKVLRIGKKYTKLPINPRKIRVAPRFQQT